MSEENEAGRDLLERLERLEVEVRELRDREAILDCIYRYARGLDRHDEQVLASAYHEDAIDRHGEARSRDEFIRWANGFHEADWSSHTHQMTNSRIEIVGETALCETYFLAGLRRTSGSTVDLAGGRYVDRLERREGEWGIVLRETVVDWQAKAEAQQFGDTAGYPQGTWDLNDPSYRLLEDGRSRSAG